MQTTARIAHSTADLASLALALIGLATILMCGLLPGLLATLAGYAVTRAAGTRRRLHTGDTRAMRRAATLVIVFCLCLLTLGGVRLANGAAEALREYQALTNYLVGVVAAVRVQLPAPVAHALPAGGAELREWLAGALRAQVPLLTGIGKSGAYGLLLVQVGIIIGAMAAAAQGTPSTGPLAVAMRARGTALYGAFIEIVLGQFGVATVNTIVIALYLLAVLPLFDVVIPHSPWLVALTFCSSLLPIVGNLLCNGVMLVAGLGVSVEVALFSLALPIALHKLEYLVIARVVGGRIATSAWELLAAIFVFESVFGLAGIVAAPLIYAYVKLELKSFGWI